MRDEVGFVGVKRLVRSCLAASASSWLAKGSVCLVF